MKRLLLSITALFITYISFSQVPQSERDALTAIYNALDGDNWNSSTNWNSTQPVSSWQWVTTGTTDWNGQPFSDGQEHVIVLSFFGGNNLSGVLPATLGDLPFLLFLYIDGSDPNDYSLPSNVSGNLPIEIGNLSLLEELWVIETDINGSIPDEYGSLSKLKTFRMFYNKISGNVPNTLLSLPELDKSFFNISNNHYTFNDLEPISQIGGFALNTYSPQYTTDNPVTFNEAPGEDITLNVNDTNLSRNTEDAAAGNEYQWFKDTILIPGADANTYTIFNAQESDSGVYYCEITNSSVQDLIIRRADITLTIDEALSLPENNDSDIKIYPNPVINWLTIKLPNSHANSEIALYDINGRKVYNGKLLSSFNSIEIGNLQSGIYIVEIKMPQGITTQRMIKK